MNKVQILAISFIENHWDEMDKKRLDLTETKEEFLKLIQNDYHMACWVVTEAMNWGCEIDYGKEYLVEWQGDFSVFKIDETYFKYDSKTHTLIEVEPKFKQVIYF